jgi:hypothetical protein
MRDVNNNTEYELWQRWSMLRNMAAGEPDVPKLISILHQVDDMQAEIEVVMAHSGDLQGKLNFDSRPNEKKSGESG